MNIALLGYGKMGHEIELAAMDRGHSIIHKFNSTNSPIPETLKESDVVIEFTRPEFAVDNIKLCMDAGVPIVCGTTGWYNRFDEVRDYCTQKNGTLFTATNFSLGVNIAFFLNKILARVMAGQKDYSLGITEIHHTRKLDAPSGTAITLAEGIIENNSLFNGWELSDETKPSGKIPIHAIREGDVPGTHVVRYTSSIDSIGLTHEAYNRKGFAVGSIAAAEWLLDKKGVFGMQDLLNFDALIK